MSDAAGQSVLGFGTYNSRVHPRIGVLLDGLRSHGVDVAEIVAPLNIDTAARVGMLAQPWRLPVLVARVLRCWADLARRGWCAARRRHPGAVVVGYLGHFDVLLARVLFPGTTIVLDHLVFAADTAADRGARGAVVQRLLRALDAAALWCADVIVVDTPEHAEMVPAGLRSRAVVVPVGAAEAWFTAGRSAAEYEREEHAPLRVVFFGMFTPLQGSTTIAEALTLLRADDEPVETLMIGTGQDHAQARRLTDGDPRVRWREWVEPDELPTLVAAHEVCLGIFGGTPKALRVVPNKVYQGAAAGCAVVTSDTGPQRRALGDAAVLVPTADAHALAQVLRRLARDSNEVARLRVAARRAANDRFTPGAVVTDLISAMAGSATVPTTSHPAGPLVTPPLSPRASLRWDVVRRIVSDLGAGTVLEIGCGQGAMGARLADRSHNYVAVEPDPASREVARNRIAPRGGTVLLGDHTVAPSAEYDLVCAFEVLEHIDDHETALAEWVRMVRPGGHVLLSVPAWPERFGSSDRKVGHFRRYTPEQLTRTMIGAGLDVPSTTLYGWPLGYALEWVGNSLDARALARGRAPAAMADRTATSGRNRQNTNRLIGAAVGWGTAPFAVAQRMVRNRGIGLVAIAQRPVDGPA